HAANRARVWNHFSYLTFDNSDVLSFITKTKAAIEQLHEVRINQDPDILAYEIIKKLPKTPEFTGISTAITHSRSAITPYLVLDHLRLSKFCFLPMHPRSTNTELTIRWPIILSLDAGKFIPIYNPITRRTPKTKIRLSTVSAHFSLPNLPIYPLLSSIRVLLT
ncbi:hypothetical protein VP01_13011g1, partial [Puccinia sorghi]